METIRKFSIKEEFERNPELKEEDLQHLREWWKKQPHFPNYMDEHLLISFLHGNYLRLEPTKTTIDNYLTVRTHTPEFFADRDPLGSKELRTMMSTIAATPLEKRSPEGYAVTYARLTNYDTDRFIYYVGLKLYVMIIEVCLMRKGTVPGNIFVLDVIGLQMVHVLRIPPMGLKKFLFFLQEAMPIRIKGIHFLNTTPVMDFLVNLMKPFLKKELMDVLHLHPDKDSLAKFVPIDIFPNEVGGKAGPLKELYAKVLKDLEDHREYFLEEQALIRVDESKRPGKPKSATDLFGVEGSFKKLDID